MMTVAPLFEESYIQYGFAGFAIILLAVLVWVIKERNSSEKESQTQLITVIEKNNSVLAKLIDALKAIEHREQNTAEEVGKFRAEISHMKNELAKRACMKDATL